MAILFNNPADHSQPWVDVFKQHLPDVSVYVYPNIPNPAEIEYAVIWDHPHGDLLNYTNLKAVLVLGAGMDHIDKDYGLPNVPIVRLVDPDVANDMAQYATYWTMHFHRQYEIYRQQAAVHGWQRQEVSRSIDYRVTVLGLGSIGETIANRIALNGFKAQAWNRSEKEVNGVDCYFGDSGLQEVLPITDVLINCLPLKPETRHLLNQANLKKLAHRAAVINVSRGPVIDDEALLALLESEHLGGAALDTFAQEPLPEDSPYWHNPKVYVTPHMSGATYAKTAAVVVADNIKRIQQGQEPFPIYTPPQSVFSAQSASSEEAQS